MKTTNASEDMEQREFLYIAGKEMQKGKTTLEDSLVNPYKTKHTLKHMVQHLYSLMCTQMS